MKKIINLMLICAFLLMTIPLDSHAKIHHDTMRATWISTVYNIDYPSTASKNNPEMQKREYIEMLDTLQDIGINTVFVQVRPKGDAFYESDINPWSDILTGTQGKYPGYDPMAFMIDEAHKRGMSFHAWLNPYRVTTSGTDLGALAWNHPARQNPDWVLSYEGKLYYNPALPEVQQHIVDTVTEIVTRYDVDGIHFDDYFYPWGYPLPAGEDRDGPVANQRRENINTMVRRVSESIANLNDEVSFGISPIGIWKNRGSDWQGSNTTGGEGYYAVFADAKTWIQNKWIDYIIPQIYWEMGHSAADYATLVKWWSDAVKGTGVKLYIGQGIYKDDIAANIDRHLLENTKYAQIEGNAFFSTKDLINNHYGVATKLKTLFTNVDSDIEIPSPSEPEQPEEGYIYKNGTVVASQLNVRQGPGTNYTIIEKVPTGGTVRVIETTSNGWYKVVLENNRVGYVSKEYVQLSSAIRLIINGQQVEPTVAPILKEGTTLVPLRIISENLGAQVEWDNIEKKVTIFKDGNQLQVTIGSKTVWANGTPTLLEIAPEIVDSTTMVPIRFIAENLGATVGWDNIEKIVKVTSEN